MMYPLNIFQFICQLYINKAGGKEDEAATVFHMSAIDQMDKMSRIDLRIHRFWDFLQLTALCASLPHAAPEAMSV